MKRITIFAVLALLLAGLSFAASAQDDMMGTEFTVTIENVSGAPLYPNSGVFNTPIDAEEPGPAFPESGYSFSFSAEAGDRLSFATMFVQSNDLFFSPDHNGIALYDEDGNAVTGDVTDQILVWDAGTEVNEELGTGENQAPRQMGADEGEDENGAVVVIEDLNATDYISVSIDSMADGEFTVTLLNVSGDAAVPTPFAPGIYVVHHGGMPLFTEGHHDRGQGLEAIAEDGDPSQLAGVLSEVVEQFVSPLAPGVFVIHQDGTPLFIEGEADRGEGLEAVAEDGDPSAFASMEGMYTYGIFNTPFDAEEPGPAFPESGYSFTFTANPGDSLSFAVMYVQSNDLFFAPADTGIALFDMDGEAIHGDITRHIYLWDAGTEVNEEIGTGENQAPRQMGADTGEDEMGTVHRVGDMGMDMMGDDMMMDDGFAYPSVPAVIRVTITTDTMDMMGN